MNKLQIDCFVSVANVGSISAAAKELFISPQVVSQHLQNLEKELGVQLFERSKNGASLTEEGIEFYAYAARTQGLFHNTLRKIREYYSSIAASLRIGISEYINIMGNISSGIASFRDSYSNISMSGGQYKNKAMMEEIERGNLDVAIMNDLQITAGADFNYQPFAREDLRLYISGTVFEKDKNSPDYIDPEQSLTENSPALKKLCRNIPHISTSYGVWSTSDWEEISRRMSTFLGYDFTTHYETENFRSAMLNLKTTPCSMVCDARFGYIPEDTDIHSFPINVESNLCCLWHKKNENPLIADFVKHMTEFYK